MRIRRESELKLWIIGLVCGIGLILGFLVTVTGIFYVCGSMDPTTACTSLYPEYLLAIGISLMLISTIALAIVAAYSFRRKRTTKGGTAT